MQLAVAAGHSVTAVAGSDDEAWVRSLGADEVLGRDADLAAHGPFTHVLDLVPVGAGVFAAVAGDGTIVSTRPVSEDPGRGITQRAMLIEQDTPALGDLVRSLAGGTLVTRGSETVRSLIGTDHARQRFPDAGACRHAYRPAQRA